MNFSFSPANVTDLPMILSWLAKSHMVEFWDNSQEHRDDIANFVHGGPQTYLGGTTKYWIGAVDDQAFAFILSDEYYDSPKIPALHRQHLSKTGKTIILDFGIGNNLFLGKGLASNMLQAFVNFYASHIDPSADTFFIDPDRNNPRALHVYEKAGFEKLGEFQVIEGAFIGEMNCLMVKKIGKPIKIDAAN